ncbi:MAG: methyltransferase domain-containing protein [Alphaproteobacteria bacterium]|nr:methyltransferase domain-containing protein [Alphaproteobacteria bacterium]
MRLNLAMLPKALTGQFMSASDIAAGYDVLATTYETAWLPHIRSKTEDLLARLPLDVPVGDVLDLGAGTGFATQRLAALYPEHAVTGVDISAGMLKQAHKADYVQADMLDFLCSRPNDSAAVVFSSWAIGYSQPDKIAKQAWRVLAEGGIFAFIVNTRDTLPRVFMAYLKTMHAYPQALTKALWPRFPNDLSFVPKAFAAEYTQHGEVLITPPLDIGDWVFGTGILAGFDQIMDFKRHPQALEYFKNELTHSSLPLAHHFVSGIFREKTC